MFLADIYLALMDRLKTIPEIKHIDLYCRQYEADEEKERESFNRPAVFIEFEPIPFQELLENRQQAEADITFHIVSDDVYNETSSVEKTTTRNRALNHLKLLDTIHKTLSGFSGPCFNSMTRTAFTPDVNQTNVYVHLMTYHTLVTDDSNKTNYVKADPQPMIKMTLKKATS